MISMKSEFKFWNRGFKNTLVLIPGWATDFRIFNSLDLSYNYLLTTKLYHFNFNYALLEKLDRENLDKVSIFGFSLGGFLASDFASKFPDRITELILVSIRKTYNSKELKDIQSQLNKNKRAYLYKFYINCFSRADQEGINWFKEHLLKQYINEMDTKELIWGLDYLASHSIQPHSLGKIQKIKIFHSSDDIIAALDESLQIKSELPQVQFIYLENLGHLPFLNLQFKHKFYYG